MAGGAGPVGAPMELPTQRSTRMPPPHAAKTGESLHYSIRNGFADVLPVMLPNPSLVSPSSLVGNAFRRLQECPALPIRKLV